MGNITTGGPKGPEGVGGRFGGAESTEKSTESGKLGGTVVKTVANATSALGEQMKNTPMSTIPQETLGNFSPAELADEMQAMRGMAGRIKGGDSKEVGSGGLEEDKEVEEEGESDKGGKKDVEEKQGKMVVSNVDEVEQQRTIEYNDFEEMMKNLFLSKKLSERGLNNSADYIAVAKKAGFEDITEIYAAVRRFEQKIDDDEDFLHKPDLKAEAKRSLRFGTRAIFQEHEPAIRAGWNLEGTHSQLELYRSSVQKAGNLADRFKVIIQQDPSNPAKFKENAELLIKYISQDITAAGGASMDTRYLRLANEEIRNAQLCLGTFGTVENLIRYMTETYKPHKLNSVEVTYEILKRVTSGWFDSSDIDHFVEIFVASPGSEKVDFVQRFLALLKSVPQTVMDQETREKVLEVGQEYIDKVIEEESKLEEET